MTILHGLSLFRMMSHVDYIFRHFLYIHFVASAWGFFLTHQQVGVYVFVIEQQVWFFSLESCFLILFWLTLMTRLWYTVLTMIQTVILWLLYDFFSIRCNFISYKYVLQYKLLTIERCKAQFLSYGTVKDRNDACKEFYITLKTWALSDCVYIKLTSSTSMDRSIIIQ